MQGCSIAGRGVTARGRHVSLVVGYASYLAYYPLGSLGAAYLGQVTDSWESILAARMLFMSSTVCVILAWMALRADGLSTARWGTRTRISFALTAVCFATLFATQGLGHETLRACLFGIALGAATATPKLGWYEAFQSVYENEGRAKCVVDIGACFLLAAVPIATMPLMAMGPLATGAVLVALVGISWAAFEVMARKQVAPACEIPRRTSYHATPFTRAILLCFGLVWGMSFTLTITLGYGGEESSPLGVLVAGLGVSAALMMAFAHSGAIEKVRFGMLLRVVIVATGCAWAFMATIASVAPSAACFLCSLAYIIQGAIMILFIAEIATDYHLSTCVVTGMHYGTFILATLVGCAAYWALFTSLDAPTATALVSALCVTGSLATIPFLPSKSSKAGVFAMDRLPNDGTYEDQVAVTRESIATKAGLTEREAEVLGCIIDGMTREQIAEELSVSVYTVKNPTARIYAKVGVHSRNELVSLAYGVRQKQA